MVSGRIMKHMHDEEVWGGPDETLNIDFQIVFEKNPFLRATLRPNSSLKVKY